MLQLYKGVKHIMVLLCVGFIWQGCNIINPVEQKPTYIHIDSFSFSSTPSYPGISNSSQITLVSVFYNNNPVGTFDLPATVPILASGTGGLQIFPGIIINGQNNTTTIYPFYRPDTSTLVAQPGKIINYQPTTGYYPALNTVLITNFETTETKFSNWPSATGQVSMVSVSGDSLVYEGRYAGSITLTNVGDSVVDSNNIPFVVPDGFALLELNYKSDVPFSLALQGNLGYGFDTGPVFQAFISPSNKWQKFYLNVTEFNKQYNANTYNLFIKAVLDSGQPAGRILIDNVQLLTF